MSMISRLKSVPLTIAPESQPDLNKVQPSHSPVPSAGVANTTDSFESADSLKTGIFTFIQQQHQVGINCCNEKLQSMLLRFSIM